MRAEAFACVFTFVVQPHPKVPIRTPFVDESFIENGDFFVCVVLFF
ncbi:uncharacterized protein METZ01_LOCUS76230 [marine metagenome]|uniref:Uncharacterized protein n=1 Tax=marine metagenome TaxID=408172 RepID=A0A381U586_9ZZZZ